MNPRSPPTRPHIGVYSSHFSTNQEWGEDDAWDSASDGEEPRHSTLAGSFNRSQPPSTVSAPKKIPKASSNSSSSTLAFSYTHVSAPNPSSYSPQTEMIPPPEASRNGWTIVQKASSGSDSRSQAGHEVTVIEKDVDVEADMVVGDFEPETGATDGSAGPGPGTRNRGQSTSKSNTRDNTVRQDVESIVTDPLNGIKNRARREPSPLPTTKPRDGKQGRSATSPEKAEKLLRERSIRSNRRQKFIECLSNTDVNIAELRKLAWAGIPYDLRPMAWQLLLGYLPLPKTLRSVTLARKRGEYQDMVDLAFARGREGLDQQIWHQIEIDVPRTRPGVRLWMYEATQRCLERILYVWAIRHPASGYVQGINDLATPFFQVFLSAYIDSDPEELDPSVLPASALQAVEADSFWCLSRLLDGIQDNYIFAQPGIQRSVRRMAELVARIDAPLSAHLESEGVEFMQFAFRWMNCLLMREISVRNTIRMWDTYLAEGADAFSQFHLYVCSAFLVKWSEKLRKMDFQGIIMFLQSLPTQDWGDHEIEMLLSEAFVLNSIWHNAQSHFNGK